MDTYSGDVARQQAADHRRIRRKDILFPFMLDHGGQPRGYYVKEVVAFAKTLGYQEYDGLGWYAVVVQKP